jgi:hypothetical protein
LKFDYFTIFEDVWLEDLEIKVSAVQLCDASLSLCFHPHFFSLLFFPFIFTCPFSFLLFPFLFHPCSPLASSTLLSCTSVRVIVWGHTACVTLRHIVWRCLSFSRQSVAVRAVLILSFSTDSTSHPCPSTHSSRLFASTES